MVLRSVMMKSTKIVASSQRKSTIELAAWGLGQATIGSHGSVQAAIGHS